MGRPVSRTYRKIKKVYQNGCVGEEGCSQLWKGPYRR
jgi:hypothetical protein